MCASFTVDSATQITCVLPAGSAGSADVQITAPGGSGSLPAAYTYVAAPANGTPPQISGTTTQGQTLTASDGTWTGSPSSYTYQWQDCDSTGANCVAIDGATSSSYNLAGGDVGHTIKVTVTAASDSGPNSATSVATALVTPTSPPAPPTPTPTPTPKPHGGPPTSGPMPVTLGHVARDGVNVTHNGSAMLSLVCPKSPTGCDASGVLMMQLPKSLATGPAATSSASEIVLARFSGARIRSGHSRLIAVRLRPALLHRLQSRHVRRVKVTLHISNHLTGRATVNTTQTVYLLIPRLPAT